MLLKFIIAVWFVKEGNCIVYRLHFLKINQHLFSVASLSYEDESYITSVLTNCTCDLTPLKCDNFCCCDLDCDDVARLFFNSSFSCLPGLEEGFSDGKHSEFNCSRNSTVYDSAFQSLLCIQLENTAFLGDYYDSSPQIGSLYEYGQIEAGDSATYQEIGPTITNDNSTQHYKVGLPVKTLYDRSEGVLGSLSLPANSLLGGCVPSNVKFLKNSYSLCNQPINQEICLKAKASSHKNIFGRLIHCVLNKCSSVSQHGTFFGTVSTFYFYFSFLSIFGQYYL